MLVDKPELRAHAADTRAAVKTEGEKFRNNSLYCRFELLTDGTLAVYMNHTMSGGNLALVLGAELPGFRDHWQTKPRCGTSSSMLTSDG